MLRTVGIQAAIQDELAQVEETLQAIKRVDFAELSEMLDHVLASAGKMLRPSIALLAGQFNDNHRQELLVPLAASIELLHTATLVHDDVIDRASTRRGRPTANSLFDNSVSVMLGDYMFAHAADLAARTGSIEVVRMFSRTLLAMARGELEQDMTAYDYGQTTRQYFQRIGSKTASLFAAAGEGGAIVSGAPDAWRLALQDYGESVGMAFQIVDDILDFSGDEVEMGKPVGSDLLQGTLTLPSLLLMERYPRDNPVKRFFRHRRSPRHLAEAVETVVSSGILDECQRVAGDFRDRAHAALEILPACEARESLAEIADYVLERRA
jgi:geranylgeranyl pyrophosphate synthase